ncbi:MAG: tail fiber protein [Anaerolineae bacterium]|nr:tail fiber protein [Anaerolineae bacterium]
MPADLFSGADRFIGVEVGTDGELLPRQRFASVPYALEAQAAENAVAADNGAPPGTIVAYAGATAPAGWLLCDGAQYSVDDYPALYAAIGSWGGDPGSFKVPDLRGRTVIGTGQGSGLTNRPLGEGGGEERHTLTIAEMPSHSHSTLVALGSGIAPIAGANWGTGQTGSTGGDGPHNNMQPYLVLNYLIKY